MRLQRINNDEMHRNTAYYIIQCNSEETAQAVEAYLSGIKGWKFCSDGLEDNELGIFVDSGIYGQEKDLKADWKEAKKAVQRLARI